jgi:hypothetical protein
MARTSTRTTALTVRFPNDLLAELRAIAVRHNLSFSRVVVVAIRLAMDPAAENSEQAAVGGLAQDRGDRAAADPGRIELGGSRFGDGAVSRG